MKKITVFDTSYGSFNMGDYIINESANKEMSFLFNNNFVVRIGTHNPVYHSYQLFHKNRVTLGYIINSDYKFLVGTNILRENMFHPWPDWNVNVFNYLPYKDIILVGCGFNGDPQNTNIYSKLLYKKMLSKKYIHSTRDEKTKKFLESLGFKAINTGCPTLWNLTPDFCKEIPSKKSKDVVFTLTDYRPDVEIDQKLINLLKLKYNKLYFWIQGSGDIEYIKKLKKFENVELINPNIEAYDNFLSTHDVDYVGTRLHAGIYAIKHKKRTIILSVDNRANDMAETYDLNVISRYSLKKLENLIDNDFKTNVKINQKAIKKWKDQFYE